MIRLPILRLFFGQTFTHRLKRVVDIVVLFRRCFKVLALERFGKRLSYHIAKSSSTVSQGNARAHTQKYIETHRDTQMHRQAQTHARKEQEQTFGFRHCMAFEVVCLVADHNARKIHLVLDLPDLLHHRLHDQAQTQKKTKSKGEE